MIIFDVEVSFLGGVAAFVKLQLTRVQMRSNEGI